MCGADPGEQSMVMNAFDVDCGIESLLNNDDKINRYLINELRRGRTK